MRRIAIIPAREGSKRIPGKNIKDFSGKPMIAHAILAAQKSGVFDEIHVSTDSQKIADVAAEYNAAPDFIRPDELSGDHATMLEVVKYVVEEYERKGQKFETVSLIYATAPLTDPGDLQKACEEFEAGDKEKALLAVTPFPAPIDQAFLKEGDVNDLTPLDAGGLASRTQDLKQAYYDAGMFCFYSSDYVTRSRGAGDFFKFCGFEVPSWRVTDIDWPEDWEHAEMLYRAMNLR